MKTRAFTLIELLVVVLIIGILAAIAVPQYQKAVMQSRATQLLTATKQLWDAQEAYFLQHGKYTTKIDDLDISFPNATGSAFYVKDDTDCGFSQYNYVYCRSQPMNVAIVQLYAGKAECYSYGPTNYNGDALCQLISKKTTYQTGCGTPECHIYAINY